MNSDSDAGDPLDNDLTAHADLPEGDRTEDHSEGRNFLAMLQLAPRSCAEAATPRTVTPTSTSTSVSPTPNQSVAPITVTKLVIPNTTSTVVVKVDTFLPTVQNNLRFVNLKNKIYWRLLQLDRAKIVKHHVFPHPK